MIEAICDNLEVLRRAARAVVPDSVVTEVLGIAEFVADLYPEETAIVARAVERRRREFAAGRSCARLALARLGSPPRPLSKGRLGEPLWPPGIVGSITHDRDWCMAAVQRAERLRGIGIDLARVQALSDGIVRAVCTPSEASRLESLPAELRAFAPVIVFSLKESVVKCCSPLLGRVPGFLEMSVDLDPSGSNVADVRLDHGFGPAAWPLVAKYALAGEYVVTSAWSA